MLSESFLSIMQPESFEKHKQEVKRIIKELVSGSLNNLIRGIAGKYNNMFQINNADTSI